MHESSPITKLSPDILFDIILRIGYGSILKCKCVSKGWHSVISNPVFINKWLNKFSKVDTSSIIPWIVLYSFRFDTSRYSFSKKRNTIIPDGLNFKFFYDAFTPGRQHFDILGSSNGLILCHHRKWINDRNILNEYYVCNPLAKKFIPLPHPCQEFTAGRCITYELSSASILGSTTVVFIPKVWFPSKAFDIEIYSSDTGEWETRTVSCPPGTTITIGVFSSVDVVALNGVLYWINGKDCPEVRTIDLKDGKGRCMSLYLSEEYDNDGCLGAPLGGPLCYCSVNRRNKRLNLWELRLVENSGEEESNEEEWGWYLVHEDIDDLSRIYDYKYSYRQPLALNPLDRDIVLLSNEYVFNIRTRSVEELEDSFDVDKPLDTDSFTNNRKFFWNKYWEYEE